MELANKDSSITFEGGFAPGKQDISERFNKLTLKNKYSNIEYLKKTKASFAVFNTSCSRMLWMEARRIFSTWEGNYFNTAEKYST